MLYGTIFIYLCFNGDIVSKGLYNYCPGSPDSILKIYHGEIENFFRLLCLPEAFHPDLDAVGMS